MPCISNDRIYCKILAHNAVHSAFAGYTGVTVGLVNTHYVLLPIPGRHLRAAQGELPPFQLPAYPGLPVTACRNAARKYICRCSSAIEANQTGLASTDNIGIRGAEVVRCNVLHAVIKRGVRLASLQMQVDPKGKMWNRLRASIGQPNFE